jgi:UTP--glucose-1-phosphate uridylyltransferase
MPTMQIRKAIITVAGFGTRLLPATKVVPKELLPVVDKPAIQYIVEEVVAAGIEDILVVTRSGTHGLADHFDRSRELERHLQEQRKFDDLATVQAIGRLANLAVIRQSSDLPYGNGSPLLAARRFLNEGEPFAYLFGDDLVLSETPCIRQLVDVYTKYQPDAVIAFQDVPRQEIRRFGAATLKAQSDPAEVLGIVEKPAPDQAPSTLAQLGRFVLSWKIIEILEEVRRGLDTAAGEELYLTFANNLLCQRGRVLAHVIEGRWFTPSDPQQFLQTNVEFALRHPRFGPEFARYLQALDLSPYLR